MENDQMGLEELANYLHRDLREVSKMASRGYLPGRKVGGEWRFLKTALQQWLSASQPTAEMRKAALLAAAGAVKDDPELIRVCEEAYRQRGRPITDDGSYNVLHGLEPGQ